MKTPITITAIHLDTSYTTDIAAGRTKVSVEIDGKWVEIINEGFDPSGFHISHICEGAGIAQRVKGA